MSTGRNKKDLGPSGFATHMFALAKPPSMSRLEYEEGGGSAQLIADDYLKHLFI
jgi:hypothetical protein